MGMEGITVARAEHLWLQHYGVAPRAENGKCWIPNGSMKDDLEILGDGISKKKKFQLRTRPDYRDYTSI